MNKKFSAAAAIRLNANFVRSNPNNSAAIAEALDVIADAMDGGIDQGIGDDAPDVGKDTQAAAAVVTQSDINAGV